MIAACVLVAPYATLASVGGCDDKKPVVAMDAGGAVRDAGALDAEPDAAGPEAANELEVTRYEDETAVDHLALTVKTPFANAYRSYPKGVVTTALKSGYAVTALAERNGFYRVTFEAPYPPARTLMGWMPRFVFDDQMATAMLDGGGDSGKIPYCSVDKLELLVVQDLAHRDPHCAYICKDDLECQKSAAVCEAAILLEPSGAMGIATQYTTVCTDAGAPISDGKRKIPSLFGIPHRGDGKCPPLFTTAPKTGKLCYRSCKVDTDCPQNAKCKLTEAKDAKLCHANN